MRLVEAVRSQRDPVDGGSREPERLANGAGIDGAIDLQAAQVVLRVHSVEPHLVQFLLSVQQVDQGLGTQLQILRSIQLSGLAHARLAKRERVEHAAESRDLPLRLAQSAAHLVSNPRFRCIGSTKRIIGATRASTGCATVEEGGGNIDSEIVFLLARQRIVDVRRAAGAERDSRQVFGFAPVQFSHRLIALGLHFLNCWNPGPIRLLKLAVVHEALGKLEGYRGRCIAAEKMSKGGPPALLLGLDLFYRRLRTLNASLGLK